MMLAKKRWSGLYLVSLISLITLCLFIFSKYSLKLDLFPFPQFKEELIFNFMSIHYVFSTRKFSNISNLNSKVKISQTEKLESSENDINISTALKYRLISVEIEDSTKFKEDKLKNPILKKLFTVQSIKHAFIVPFFLNKVGIANSNNPDPILQYCISMTVLLLIALFCFINVFGYLLSLYILNKYNIENKYPRLSLFINYFKKTSQLMIIIECSLGFVSLIMMLLLNILLITTISNL